MKIKYINHSCFLVTLNDGTEIVFDPFVSSKEARNEIKNKDYVFITHLHNDHFGSINDVYSKDKTTCVAFVEAASILNELGYKNCECLNYGGCYKQENFELHMVKALHSSSISKNRQIVYAGEPCGYVLKADNEVLYYTGDTDIFLDMKLICDYFKPTIILMCVGGKYTLDIDKAIYATEHLLSANLLIPMHYSTFKEINVDLEKLINNSKITIKNLRLMEEIEL